MAKEIETPPNKNLQAWIRRTRTEQAGQALLGRNEPMWRDMDRVFTKLTGLGGTLPRTSEQQAEYEDLEHTVTSWFGSGEQRSEIEQGWIRRSRLLQEVDQVVNKSGV